MASDKQLTAGHYYGLVPVALLLALVVILHLVFHNRPITRTVFDPPLLLPLLHMTFLCATSLIVSYIAAQSYLLTGVASVALLGCGVLALGIARMRIAFTT